MKTTNKYNKKILCLDWNQLWTFIEKLLTKHIDKSPSEIKKAAELFGDLNLIRIEIQDQPADTVVQWVEHRRNKPRA